jgi:hypothetical protein
VVHVGAHPVGGVAQRQVAVEDQRGRHRSGCGDHVAARDVAALDADEVDGDALARVGALDGLVVDLHGADPDRGAGREQDQAVAGRDRSGPQGARHHGARAVDGEGAVDVQQRLAGARVAAGEAVCDPVERGTHVLDAGAGARRARDDRGIRKQLARLRCGARGRRRRPS